MNLQTEVKKKVMLDNEYLSFRWTGGFELTQKNGNNGNAQNQFNGNFPTNNQFYQMNVPPIYYK